MSRKTPALSIRMYRHGLGDCFLLKFAGANGKPFHVMIDCGVVLGTPNAAGAMKQVVEDIAEETGGAIDLLAATHEHWDHLSGFVQAKETFEKLRVARVWLAWTEDPANPLARRLAGERKRAVEALRATSERLRGLRPETAAGLDGVLEFFGAAGGATTSDALEVVRAAAKSTRYCRPKDAPVVFSELPGVRFYVLGPPEDLKLIGKSSPSKGQVYEDKAFALDLETAFYAAALGDQTLQQASYPFDKCNYLSPGEAQKNDFFERHYFGDDREEKDPDCRDQSWRRIDTDWLDVASQLALQLDSDTNNTSLVLAVELVESGRVLLFAADAQVGNWLSWSDLAWRVDGAPVTGPDLLKRTVVYKVGHHGSHNATLREKGLERMTNPDLMVLLPVDHAMAVKKRWAGMPFPPLMERLTEKAGGRVLRIDDKVPLANRKPPAGVTPAVWKDFQSSVVETPLYYELRLD